jgi:hypothetical protein
MLMREFLYHAGGIGCVALTAVLLLSGYVVRGDGLAYGLWAVAAAPGYVAARWLLRRTW